MSTSTAAPSSPLTTPSALSAAAKRLYPAGSLVLRKFQQYRPYICPFHTLLDVVPAGASVLDVGCGGGLFLGLLARAERISRGVGFDSAGPAIDIAKEMAARAGFSNLEFIHLAVQDPWPEGEFDVVSFIDVLHHVPPAAQEGVVRQAAAKVRPGGMLLVKDIYPESFWRAMANRMHDLLVARQWIHFVTGRQVTQWAEGAGLRAGRRERINMLWYGHELMVFERTT